MSSLKSSKLLGRSICGPMMVLFTFFFAMDVSSAADTPTEKRITKQFLTSGQVDLAREVVKLPLHRGRLSSGETVRRKRFRHFQENGSHMGAASQ